MKKYINYIGLLAVGLLLGWFIFGNNSSNDKTAHNHDEVVKGNQMWTCSMHPQIMQPEAGDCPICGMDLIPAEVGAEGLGVNEFKLTENAMALANVEVVKVGVTENSKNTMIISGKIVENKETIETLSAHYNGRVEKLYVTFLGEKIQKGHPVAEIYSSELVNAQQELLTAYKMKDVNESLYASVRKKFENWQIQSSQLDKIVETGKIKNSFTIYAHSSGVVSEIFVEKGAHITDGKPIFKIANLHTVWAEFDVYENQLNLFTLGQKVEIATNASPNKIVKGTVSFINPVLNTATRTVKIRVVLNNNDGLLKPGMFVSGSVFLNDTSSNGDDVTIPASAVLWTGKRSVVYIKTSEDLPVFELREVALGVKNGDMYQVVSGLEKGDVVVSNGAFTVDAAAQLQGKKSMMRSSNTKEETISIERISVSEKFKAQLSFMFDEYQNLKNSLVKDDSGLAKISAQKLLTTINKVDMKLLKEKEAHEQWMHIEKKLITASEAISKTDKIEEQRKYFEDFSNPFITAVQLFGIDKKVYKQFCPMANNDKGAFWLSESDVIANPYFGASMLKCGEVKEIIH